MANTTNFNWETPDDTDLVKDGAAAMRTLGNSIDTSFVDLKGGTTGQVLSKASNTDLDYTWVTSDDANAIQNAIVDAKGDLIAASAADTPARLAVGADGETLVADSSTSTGLRYQGSMAAGRNLIINGGMDIWQRGTGSTAISALGTYSADRWQAYRSVSSTSTVSRQLTGDTTNLPFLQYCTRVQRDSGNTSAATILFVNSSETVNSIPFAGKTVVFSFYARAGANFSAASSQLTVQLQTGTGTDQNALMTGYTGLTNAVNSTATLTTTWQRFTYTATLGTTITEIAPYFTFTPSGTAGANDYYEITGVQVEVGSVATNFTRAGGSIQEELAACQRYYIRWTGANSGNGYFYVPAWLGTTSTSGGYGNIPLAVPMRVAPTTYGFTAGGIYVTAPNDNRVTALTSLSFTNANIDTSAGFSFGSAASLTSTLWYKLQSGGTSTNYFELGAEL